MKYSEKKPCETTANDGCSHGLDIVSDIQESGCSQHKQKEASQQSRSEATAKGMLTSEQLLWMQALFLT